MAALRAAVFPLFAKNRRGGHFLPPPLPVRVLKDGVVFGVEMVTWPARYLGRCYR